MEAIRTLPDGLPKLTLGWGVLAWCGKYIRQPDGPDAGGPWTFTDEQARFILWLYAIDKQGRWIYNRAAKRRAKGAGKSGEAAALALVELCGPVRFSHFDKTKRGGAVGQPSTPAWVQLAGVSEKQTQNTMSFVIAMSNESPIVADYGLDIGVTRILTKSGGKLEPITASAPSAEGARPTFCIADETHWWTATNGGHKLEQVMRRNLAKSRDGTARMMETTNAHAPGEDSVAERTYQEYVAQQSNKTRTSRLLYDSISPPEDIDISDEDVALEALAVAYGDSTWVDLERIRDEVYSTSTPVSTSKRFYFNLIAESDDAWIAPGEWQACFDEEKVLAAKDTITLGFDGSRSRSHATTDATALIGCRVSDGHIFQIAVWEQPAGPQGKDWRVPVAEVQAAVRDAFKTYRVVGFYADPAKWEGVVAEWEATYGPKLKVGKRANPIEFWMTGGRRIVVAQALEQFHSAVVDRELTHDGAFTLTQHITNAHRRVSRNTVQIAKENPESPRKIDAAVAAVLAWQARLDAVAAGEGTTRAKSRRLTFA